MEVYANDIVQESGDSIESQLVEDATAETLGVETLNLANPEESPATPSSITAANTNDAFGTHYVPPANAYSTPIICTKYIGAPTIHAREGQRTTDRPRVLIGWYHQGDNGASLLQGRLFAAVTENNGALQIFDQVFNRSEDLAIGQHCGVAHFAMVKMFHPDWCITEGIGGALRIPVNGVSADKRHCREVYLGILRSRGQEVGYHLGEVEEDASTIVDRDDDDNQRDAPVTAAVINGAQVPNNDDADVNTASLNWSTLGSSTTRDVGTSHDVDAGPKRKRKKQTPISKATDDLPPKKKRGRPSKKDKAPTKSTSPSHPDPASQESLFVESDDTDTSVYSEAQLGSDNPSVTTSYEPQIGLELPELGSEDLEHDMDIDFTNLSSAPCSQDHPDTTDNCFMPPGREAGRFDYCGSREPTPRPKIKQEDSTDYGIATNPGDTTRSASTPSVEKASVHADVRNGRSVSVKSQFLEQGLYEIPLYRGGGTVSDPLELEDD